MKGGWSRSGPGVEGLEARYDREADVLYVSSGAPEEVDDAELTGEDIVLRYRAGKVLWFTVFWACRFGPEPEKYGSHRGNCCSPRPFGRHVVKKKAA